MAQHKMKEKKTCAPNKSKSGMGKKLLLSLVTIIVVLGAAELMMRRLYPSDPESRWSQHHFRVDSLGFSELNEIMAPDPDLFWHVKPGLKDRLVTGFVGTDVLLNFMVSTDEQGFRIMDDGSEAPENILFLGDSCTFGIGIKAKETCAARTGAALGMRTRNMSCPGYTLYQGTKLLERMGWEPLPKALVVGFGFNDRLMWDGLTDPEQAALLSSPASAMAEHSRLWHCMELAVKGTLRLLRKTDEPARRMPPELFEQEADTLIMQAESLHVPIVFLFWPRIEWMNEPGSGHPYADLLADHVDGKQSAILDLADAFRARGGETLYLDGIHAKPEGHRIAAEELVKLLENMIVN